MSANASNTNSPEPTDPMGSSANSSSAVSSSGDSSTQESPDLIFAYTRAQALADGVLIDLSDLAHDAGFIFPLAVTEAVYNSYLNPSPALAAEGQSFSGRAWDLLTVLRYAIESSAHDSDALFFDVLFVLAPGTAPKAVSLKAVCSPGDACEPVLTVMLPSED